MRTRNAARANQSAVSMKKLTKLAERYRVDRGKGFRLRDFAPDDTGGLSESKDGAQQLLSRGVELLSEYQDKLYAQDRWAVLLIFQAMDAAGKDGTIKHVMSGVNPQGVEVSSFKSPSTEELDHDYLWRSMRRVPERGRIGIFNRSYYEETLVVRVHKNLLAAQHIPQKLVTKRIWKERFEDINAVERYLSRNGVVIRKFFLNVSKEEQKKRFLKRLDEPEKNWKFSTADVHERQCWDGYAEAYEDMIRHTATEHAPWYVVPADNKWYTRLVVSVVVAETLKSLKLEYPAVDKEKRKSLAEAKAALLGENSKAKQPSQQKANRAQAS